ncbi:family 16 glycoside hydrolase [Runella sp.]|uniref:family 16 glycoside hydrolase n=1 Tax=Runella sp. TaxID=1960881 RepID=UPI003D152119
MKIRIAFQTGCLLLAAGLIFSLNAQNTGMTQLTTDGNGPFQLSGEWKIVGSTTMHPEKSSFLKTTPTTDKSAGIILGKTGAKGVATLGLGDIVLKMDFMLAPGSNANLILPGGYAIKLNDSWKSTRSDANAVGSIGTLAPLKNAAKAPGLWQSLTVQFKRAGQNTAAQIERLTLNGVTVQENAFLSTPPTTDIALSLNVVTGAAAFRNIFYQLLNDTHPVTLSNLSYTLYKAGNDKPKALVAENLIKKDTTSILTREWGMGNNSYYLIYDGQMNVAQEADYTFQLAYMSNAALEIDGNTVLPYQWNDFLQNYVPVTVHLTKGTHSFRLHHHKFTWRRNGLGMFVVTQGVRQYPLHVTSSLPEPTPIPTIEVTANGKAELVRSFIQRDGEKGKRTHCLSVGTPEDINYTLDLNRGSLLQFWKGGFANVTDMWYERGEPQLLVPMGAAITTTGQTDIAVLKDLNAAWPDSTADLTFKGYRLNAAGIPTVTYRTANVDITDEIIPENGGLSRTINGNLPNTYVRLVSGKNITMLEKGLYEIDGQRYYVRVDPNSKPVVRTVNGKQELLLALNGQLHYSLIW